MKSLFFLVILCLTNYVTAQNTEWYAAPNGSPSGTGSYDNPWDLQTAFENPAGVILEGHTLWLRGGVYRGRFVSELEGTPTQNVIVSSYPGEWAILDGNIYEDSNPVNEGITPLCSSLLNRQEVVLESEWTDIIEYNVNDEETSNNVLEITGAHVTFMNFEVTHLGNLYRVKNTISPNPLYNNAAGVGHNVKTNLVNLVIRNNPGLGIGSWKFGNDSRIYGNIIYNNGYTCKQFDKLGNLEMLGKGPGIYTQNLDGNDTRVIENNFIMNNYDSGLIIWSAQESPTSHFLHNYRVENNVIFENGQPSRRHLVGSSNITDSKPNMFVDSGSTHSTNNHATDITIINNVFYLYGSSYISGIRLGNVADVTLTNNYILKGTAGISFLDNNTGVNFTHNTYMGKRIQINDWPNGFTLKYTLGNNDYHAWQYQAYATPVRIPISINSEGVVSYAPTSFSNYQSLYSTDLTSTVQQALHTDLGPGKIALRSLYNATDTPNPLPQKNHIIQNEFTPNLFYVTIHNPRPDLASTALPVDFTAYNIPTGTSYTVRDVQNYFGGPVASGTLSSTKIINFDLTLQDFEPPLGFYDTCPGHTLKEFGTFIVEFGCSSLYNLDVVGSYNNTTPYSARHRIYFGSPSALYILNSAGNHTAEAENQIILRNSTIKAGASFHAKIEDLCLDLEYVVMSKSNQRKNAPVQTDTSIIQSFNSTRVHPNPTKGITTISTSKERTMSKVEIYDVIGGHPLQITQVKNENKIELDVSSMKKGVYTAIIFFTDGSSETTKILKE